MKLEHEAKEQIAAEERLHKEAERIQHEREEHLKILEEERKKKDEEQRLKEEEKRRSDEEQLKVLEEERKRKEEEQLLKKEEEKRSEEVERLKQMEDEQKSQEVQSLIAVTELKQEAPQNNLHKPLNKQQKQPRVKYDEESRLHEQLKILQEQALKQKENEHNEKVSKDTNLTVDNRVTEPLGQKHKEKVTIANESERQRKEKRSSQKTKKQTQSVKVQEEQKSLETQKCENVQAPQNNDSQQKQMKRKETGEMGELSGKKEEGKPKHERQENGTNKLLLAQKNKDTSLENLTRNKQQKRQSPDHESRELTLVHADHEVKLKPSTSRTENSVKYENHPSTVHNEAACSKVACQSPKPDAAKCQVKSTSREVNNAWEKTVEAKRLQWMHGCESWRYI